MRTLFREMTVEKRLWEEAEKMLNSVLETRLSLLGFAKKVGWWGWKKRERREGEGSCLLSFRPSPLFFLFFGLCVSKDCAMFSGRLCQRRKRETFFDGGGREEGLCIAAASG